MFKGSLSFRGSFRSKPWCVHVPTRGRSLVIEQWGELFDFWENQKLVVHRALRVHTCGESCTGKGEMHGVSVLFSFWHDCVEPCLCLWGVMLVFDRLRRAVALVLGNWSLLGQVTCSCFFRAFVTCSSSLLLLCSSLFLFQSWFVCGVLTMHSSRGRLRNVEYSILLVMSELSTVRCDHACKIWAPLDLIWPSNHRSFQRSQAGKMFLDSVFPITGWTDAVSSFSEEEEQRLAYAPAQSVMLDLATSACQLLLHVIMCHLVELDLATSAR